MKKITTTVKNCPMWKRLDLGTVLVVPDSEADTALIENWAVEAEENNNGN